MLAPLLVVVAFSIAQPTTKTSELRETTEALGERTLTATIEGVTKGTPGACEKLSALLNLYWWPPLDQRTEWPRVMRRPIPAAVKQEKWRSAADACVREALKGPVPEGQLGLLQSPLLHDDGLRGKAIARGDEQHIGRGGGYTSPDPFKVERSVSPVESEPVLLSPGLGAELISTWIRRHRNQVTYCYESELRARPTLAGELEVEFSLKRGGENGRAKVTDVMKASSSINDPVVELCILHSLPGWAFPAPRKNEPEPRVGYRFVFRPVPAK